MSGNEMLFYGGITVFICSGIAAVISFGTLKLKAIRLHAKFDEEYGKEKNVTVMCSWHITCALEKKLS